MKYQVGDIVRIKSDLVVGEKYGAYDYVSDMHKYSGKLMTIGVTNAHSYCLKEDSTKCYWTDEMIDQKVNKYDVGSLIRIRPDLKAGEQYNGVTLPVHRVDYAGKQYKIQSCYYANDKYIAYGLEGNSYVWTEEMLTEIYPESISPTFKYKVGDCVILRSDLNSSTSYNGLYAGNLAEHVGETIQIYNCFLNDMRKPRYRVSYGYTASEEMIIGLDPRQEWHIGDVVYIKPHLKEGETYEFTDVSKEVSKHTGEPVTISKISTYIDGTIYYRCKEYPRSRFSASMLCAWSPYGTKVTSQLTSESGIVAVDRPIEAYTTSTMAEVESDFKIIVKKSTKITFE